MTPKPYLKRSYNSEYSDEEAINDDPENNVSIIIVNF